MSLAFVVSVLKSALSLVAVLKMFSLLGFQQFYFDVPGIAFFILLGVHRTC